MSWMSGLGNSNFGGWSGDYFSEYYMPPADGRANSIDFHMSDLPEVTGGSMSVAIYAANYPWDELDEEMLADISPQCWLGYYDNEGVFDIAGDNWVFGGINDVVGADSIYQYDPLGEQLWPDSGMVDIPLYPDSLEYVTLTLNLEDSEFGSFDFERNDPFFVVVKLAGFEDQPATTEYRTGFQSERIHHTPQPCLKFYNVVASPDGRTEINDWGWHIRSYAWNWSVNINIGSAPYLHFELDNLWTTLSTEDRWVAVEITDQNPAGTDEFLDSVSLGYRVDGIPAEQIEMSSSGNDMYTASLPGQNAGSTVEYWVEAIDILGNQHTSEVKSYRIFAPEHPTLLVYDAEDNPGEEWRYMEGLDPAFSEHYDLWEASFGPISSELVNQYTTIFHVMGGSFFHQTYDLSTIYFDWLETGTEDNEHCLLISGQDYFSGVWEPVFPVESFANRFLGLESLGPVDANYDGTQASYMGPYAIDAVPRDSLTGFLFNHTGDSLQMYYEPLRELGFYNWIDNIWPSSGTIALTDPNHGNNAVAVYNSGPGWKTSFWALDPLGINYYSPTDTLSYYQSAVNSAGNPVARIFEWFRGAITVDLNNEQMIPQDTYLHASYPNPFNPVTNIAYDLNRSTDVDITVYNMLGQEVVTLQAGFQVAGTYTVQWNGVDHSGHSVASGLYFYTLRTDRFTSTKKMMLLK